MATIIIDHDGGLLNEVYTNLPEPLQIKDFVSDDQYDSEHAGQYAACSYAAKHAALAAHFSGQTDPGPRLWTRLERRPDALNLIAEIFRSPEDGTAVEQALDSVFAAGYMEAVGDLNAFIRDEVYIDGEHREARRILRGLSDRMLEKFFEFCSQLNQPEQGANEAVGE